MNLSLSSMIILGMGSANEGRCYKVTSSLIGLGHTQVGLCHGAEASVATEWEASV